MIEIFFGLLIFLFLSLSVSHMWSHAEIFSRLRSKAARIPYIRRPLICPECFSFWAGLLISLSFNPLTSILYIGLSNIFCGLITYLVADALYKKEILRG